MLLKNLLKNNQSVQLGPTVEDVRRPAVTNVLVDNAPVTMSTVLATWDVLQGTTEHCVKMVRCSRHKKYQMHNS